MEHDKRTALEQRREQLQAKLRAEAYIERYLAPSLDVLDYLSQHGVAYRIVGLVSVPAEYHSHVRRAIDRTPYRQHGFPAVGLDHPALEALLQVLRERFPDAQQMTCYANYRASSPEIVQRDGLQTAVQALALPEQPVYVYFPRYHLILEVDLAHLLPHDHEDVFNTWHEDVLIFSATADWLILFTMEEEWLGAKHPLTGIPETGQAH